MKVIHTSDIHLTDDEKYQHRWDALKEIVEVFKKEEADILVIVGDLFDSIKDSRKTYERLREIFDNLQVVILPGNHDKEAYREGMDLGKNVTVIRNGEEVLDFEEVVFIGLPYEDGLQTPEKVYARLLQASEKRKSNKCNILLFHGELLSKAYDSTNDFYEKGRYMPVSFEILDSLGFNYILAGHFHTRYDVKESENRYFVYPGSPVSISRKEKGRRKINVIEVGEKPRSVELNSFHYIEKEVRLNIDDNENPIDKINRAVQKELVDSNCSLLVNITGYFDGAKFSITEQLLTKHIYTLVETYNIEFQFNAKDIGNIIASNRLLYRIIEKINGKELGEERRYALIKRFVDAFLEIK
ncbi:MAG: DNA repair exonuclease [Fervidobacterium sp.]|uniref:metallophosphoesterase family protein n=1 Tax=Fervidobacterium TaxID=2422 RepID=UPI0021FDE7F5|nr:hypothetical protein IB67_07000 [Fervidobacterium riparium]